MDDLTALAGAVDRGEITTVFQTQVNTVTLEPVGIEALVRWYNSASGMVSPAVFIPYAEQTGLIDEISRHVTAQACHAAATWKALGLNLSMAINVSPAQLTDTRYVDSLTQSFTEAGLEPGDLVFEVTESLPLAVTPTVTSRLRDLCEAGMMISIDDYGTGYATHTWLEDLPATEIKIDKTLIHTAATSGNLLAEIAELASAHGLRLVGEGIETLEHLEIARKLGCDRAQGFLFSHPLPEDETTRALQSIR